MKEDLTILNTAEQAIIQPREEEIWKPIPGYEGYYEASSFGRIRSVGRYIKYRHGLRWHAPRIRATITYQGYDYVNLVVTKDNKYNEKRFLVHRLIAETFIPNPDNKRCVDHINTIRTDNRVENLRWVTHLENQKNPITAKRLAEPARPVVRMSPDGSIKEYPMLKSVVEDGFNMSQVCLCCKGKQFTHMGFLWSYKGEPIRDYETYIQEKRKRFLLGIAKKRKPFIAFNDKETIEFSGQLEAKDKGFDARAIGHCIKSGKTYKGYHWRFK